MAEFVLSAFADEAGIKIKDQIKACKDNGITHIELRGLENGNISDFSSDEAKKLKKILDENDIGVSAIGSKFGKIKITEDFREHFDQFKQCVENACILGTENIRMFSFYTEGAEHSSCLRDEVFMRLDRMAEEALKSGIRCCHENEKGIYGDTDDRCLDILKTFEGRIDGIFDPANFVQCHVKTVPAYEKLESYIKYMHIKDCRFSDGYVVPCGKGDGDIEELLRRFSEKDGKRFLTLEPHLKIFKGLENLELSGGTESVSEEYSYPDNRAAFDAAAKALHEVLDRVLG